jgi:hypothetical protein
MAAVGLFAGSIALLSGCGGGVGDVSGKVTFKGKPVVYGSVGFVGSDGVPKTAKISPDGSYAVKDVRAGEAKITVTSELPAKTARSAEVPPDWPKEVPPPDKGEAGETIDPEVAKKWFPISPDLGDINKTKLRFQVKRGAQTYDIQLD